MTILSFPARRWLHSGAIVIEHPTPLMVAMAGLHPTNAESVTAMRALPACTLIEAMMLAIGDPEEVEALLVQKPDLRPIEDFIQNHIW